VKMSGPASLTIRVDMTSARPANAKGILASTLPISFVMRVIMRPVGVSSSHLQCAFSNWARPSVATHRQVDRRIESTSLELITREA